VAATDAPSPLVAIRNLTKYYTRGEQVIPVLVDINIDVMAANTSPHGARPVRGNPRC
jgi:hypothetical protein